MEPTVVASVTSKLGALGFAEYAQRRA